jgi:putative spermidine/putrescine transport system substrate-binding protein
VKWWEPGAVPPQMLPDREVVMTSVWNGRVVALKDAGVPAAINWNQGLLKRDCWAVPTGSPSRANAMKVIAFSTMPMPQLAIGRSNAFQGASIVLSGIEERFDNVGAVRGISLD